MLQSLLNVPMNENEWSEWSWHHSDHHAIIRQAILRQKSVNLNDYQVNPINFDFIQTFLERNQRLHNEMNTTIGNQASDLQEVDFNDKSELESWISAHYQEHYDMAQALNI